MDWGRRFQLAGVFACAVMRQRTLEDKLTLQRDCGIDVPLLRACDDVQQLQRHCAN